MLGMSASTGTALSGEDHLRQSVQDILMTPIGSRVGLRDYGSVVPELIDAPLNMLTRLRLFAASAVAIARWEPRLRVTGFALAASVDGSADLTVTGQRLDVAPATSLTRLLVPLR